MAEDAIVGNKSVMKSKKSIILEIELLGVASLIEMLPYYMRGLPHHQVRRNGHPYPNYSTLLFFDLTTLEETDTCFHQVHDSSTSGTPGGRGAGAPQQPKVEKLESDSVEG